jgi:hydrogenase expression/formation protein HypE
MMRRLIHDLMAPAFEMESLSDSAVVDLIPSGRTALTTDSYVVSPLFFPGGDIGKLAVCGTVNDLSMAGARPLYLTAGFIIEEGLLISDLEKIVSSMAETARQTGIKIVAGDTKVVERGKCDGLFINTAGVGVIENDLELSAKKIRPGDTVIVSGPLGTHGIAVMAERNGLTFEPPIQSDTAPLNGLVSEMLGTCSGVRVMRDPTRGGLATALVEISDESSYRILLREDALPILPGVRGACELLGLDPLHVANEGVLVSIVNAAEAEDLLSVMRKHPLASNARNIGNVSEETDGRVLLETVAGGTRILDMLTGQQLPRIC